MKEFSCIRNFFDKLISYSPVHVNNVFETVVELEINKQKKIEHERGNGQIDSSIKAVRKIISGNDIELKYFNSSSVGPGSDAIGQTKVIVSKNSREVKGNSYNSDVVRSAIEAFIDGANRLNYIEDYFLTTKT